MYEPEGLAEVKAGTMVPVTSGENLFGIREYRPYFENRSMDNVMIDVPWNGFARSRDIAMLAESYELNIAPHNYYSHLSTCIRLICAHPFQMYELWKLILTMYPGRMKSPVGP
ncbi:MAG: hypothetical protein Ct9H300mP19_13020 [Dehalococcoidia bacterium]|nr:MAG: hypothetical protein Ct9H300mP19_13020 [Dehalococcoidia bacterium]